MKRVPIGTVTLVFTDIEDSTQLLHALGREDATVLAERHRGPLPADARSRP